MSYTKHHHPHLAIPFTQSNQVRGKQESGKKEKNRKQADFYQGLILLLLNHHKLEWALKFTADCRKTIGV